MFPTTRAEVKTFRRNIAYYYSIYKTLVQDGFSMHHCVVNYPDIYIFGREYIADHRRAVEKQKELGCGALHVTCGNESFHLNDPGLNSSQSLFLK